MAVASFGQRFQITPIQLITAYSAIANGGSLMKPRLVKELTDGNGNVVKTFAPQVVRNVISKKTSDTLKAILEGVVTWGTGHNAYVRGYRLAGKTGTSETLTTTDSGRLISSFMTFAPADDPVVSILIVLDHPDVTTVSGGYLAAPIAGRLMEQILTYLGVERRYTEADLLNLPKMTSVPDCTGKTIEEARILLETYGLRYTVEGAGEAIPADAKVAAQNPAEFTELVDKSVVVLYTGKPERQTMVAMPDLGGMNVDEAILTLGSVGLNIKVNGLGTVSRQSVPYGTEIAKGSVVEVELLDTNVH
jgi:stage V sporulation protein D (sporulation-specific penicillin-binding protein)